MITLNATTFEKRSSSDLLVLPFLKTKEGPKIACEGVFGPFLEAIKLPIQAKDFIGKNGEVLVVYANEAYEKRVALVGLGDSEGLSLEEIRRAYAALLKRAHKLKIKALSLCVPDLQKISHKDTSKAIAEAVLSTNYLFCKMKGEGSKDDPFVPVEKIDFLTVEPKIAQESIDEVVAIMKGVYLSRDLVNGNADDITPEYLAKVARNLGTDFSKIEVSVYEKEWIESMGMGLYLAVAKGAQNTPRFIVVKYKGNEDSSDHTVLVGKGLTFDSGGLNLKPTGNIESQRVDMSGAAAVLGTLQAIAALNLPLNVTGVIASCENAIGSKAYKPGDVYVSMAKKTVEITNTDAEGRLTLGDALYYAATKLEASRIIDIATLTGAMCVALGDQLCGIMGNSDSLEQALFVSGERTFERCWKFPIYKEYSEKLKSDIADLKNTSSREGGGIFGGAFLKEFVENVPWVHMDIAPVAFLKEDRHYIPKMGTGFGVRLLVDYLQQFCSTKP